MEELSNEISETVELNVHEDSSVSVRSRNIMYKAIDSSTYSHPISHQYSCYAIFETKKGIR